MPEVAKQPKQPTHQAEPSGSVELLLNKGAAAALLKSQLDEHGVATPKALAEALNIKPQVIYNYIRQGRIGATYNSSGKRVITETEVKKYLTKRIERQNAKQERIEKELRGELT